MKRGRPKGYSPYTDIPYEELADYVGRKTLVKVCKSWLDELIDQTRQPEKDCKSVERDADESEQPKIEYQITNFDE